MPTSLARRTGRHLLTAILALALFYFFLGLRSGTGVHAMNRSFADAAFVLLVITMALGPLAKMAPRLRPALTWRHEFGVWTIVLAAAHLYIILDGWVQWDLRGFYLIPGREGEFINRSFLMGNLLGAIALSYGLLLLVTSNRWVQRRLGRSWGYIQAGSRIYLLLVVLHSAYFLLWHYSNLREVTPSVFVAPFLLLSGILYLLIALGFFATLKQNRRRVAARGRRVD
ncbi:MAG: ferric reductase-like transmembrane domain-containing protein [Thermoplasmata archaeon]